MFHSSARPHLPLKTTNMDGIGARIKLNFKLRKHSAQSKSGVNILRSAHQHSYCLSLGVPDTDKTITFIVITFHYRMYPHSCSILLTTLSILRCRGPEYRRVLPGAEGALRVPVSQCLRQRPLRAGQAGALPQV